MDVNIDEDEVVITSLEEGFPVSADDSILEVLVTPRAVVNNVLANSVELVSPDVLVNSVPEGAADSMLVCSLEVVGSLVLVTPPVWVLDGERELVIAVDSKFVDPAPPIDSIVLVISALVISFEVGL